MNEIKFCKNWNNKLSGNVFTTIREYGINSGLKYVKTIDEIYNVYLLDNLLCQARLVDVWTIRYENIPYPLLVTGTGIVGRDKNFEIFKKFGIEDNDDFVTILTFEKVDA
jgi:hypothetical protein